MNELDVYRGCKALVVGASGFIGRHVAAELHRAGAELVIAVRNPDAARAALSEHDADGVVCVVDLAQSGAAAQLVEVLEPSIVFNLAGYGVDRSERDEALAQRLNSDLVAELAEAVDPDPHWTGPALVHAGSALEFGTERGDLADPWRCSPTTLYGRTKLEGSQRLREIGSRRGIGVLNARLFTVYGPGEHAGRLLPTLLQAIRGEERIPLSEGLQRRDFTYVAEVAEGLLRLGASPAAAREGALNLASGELTAVREFVETAARVLGLDSVRLGFGALPTRADEMSHEPVSTAALERAVAWKPSVAIEAGIRRTLEFERRCGRA
jgi:nucleoside-diphosphate-sugar epimerase